MDNKAYISIFTVRNSLCYTFSQFTVFLIVFLILTPFNTAFSDDSWAKTYGGNGLDYASSIQQTADGGYIVAGFSDSFGAGLIDFWILKLTGNGVAVWQKTYGGNSEEDATSIQQTSDGGYIVAGRTNSFAAEGHDMWILKLNVDGTAAWQKTYGGSSEEVRSIQQTSDGGYIVAGFTYSSGTESFDMWILKLNENGAAAWQKTYGGSDYEEARSIQQTADGGYIVAGFSDSFGAGYRNMWILKLNGDGTVAWEKTYGENDLDYAHSIQQTADGGYIVAGSTYLGAGDYDMWILKLNGDGTATWEKTYGGNAQDEAHSIQQTADGGYIVAGRTDSFGVGSHDMWILKLNGDGTEAWQKTYGGSSLEEVNSVQQTSDGGYIVAGRTDSFGAGSSDMWILKLDSNGEIGDSCDLIDETSIIPNDTNASITNTDAVITNTSITGIDSSATVQDTSLTTETQCQSESTTFQWPIYPYTLTPTSITQYYADDSSGDYHTGIDMDTAIDANDTVKAVAGGKVRRLDMNKNDPINPNNHEMGNVVIIDHSFGTNPVGSFFSLYAHLASIDVDDEAIIEKGDPIGTIGDTGCRDLDPPCGKHLHLEFKPWNVLGNLDDDLGPYWGYTPDQPNWYGYINPYPYLEYDIINISPTAILVTTTTEELLRTGPGTDYEETFGSVSDKQKFVAFSEYNGWYQVYIPSNYGPATGWIQGTVESSATILEVNDPTRGTIGVCVRDSASKTGTCEEGNGISNVWDDQWVVHTGQTQTASADECGEQWYEIYLPDLPDGLSSLTGWVCGEYLLVSDKVPAPDIKANNSDEQITIGTSDSLSVSIGLDAGDYSGESCDWYIVVNTPSGWQSFNVSQMDYSTSGLSALLQNYGLISLGPTEIFSTSSLSVGTYTFYFAIDLSGQLYYDSVVVTVEAMEVSAPTGFTASASGSTLTLSWNAVSGADGYYLYYGLSSGNYAGSVDLGNNTSQSFSGIPDGTYYLAITAYADSNESSYSDEVSITIGEQNASPTATITSPSTGSTYTQGDSITFSGTGNDTEDGNLSGGSLVWTSSVDGQIGTGTSFTYSGLSVSTHTMTLTVTDSEGATGSNSVIITVESIVISNYNLPDTGQTESYTDTFGEDSDYTINPPSYTDNGDGTVTDNVTRLMWQQEDDDNTYTWDDSVSYCDSLSLASYSDWRLPEIKELVDIVDYGSYDPAIDETYFPNTNSSRYLSSTARGGSFTWMWHVYFDSGIYYSSNSANQSYVRCVRNGQYPDQSFTDNSDGTVTDNVTGLMWQKEEEDKERNWEDAIAYCEGLSLADYSDWRLPTIKELNSIVDHDEIDPAIDETYFPNTNSSSYWYNYWLEYWTSTTSTSNTSESCAVSFFYGNNNNNYTKTNNGHVRCVRGGE